MQSFKEYYEFMFTESPMRTGMHFPSDFDTHGGNLFMSQDIIERLSKVDQLKFPESDVDIAVYQDHIRDKRYADYFLDSQPKLRCYFMYDIKDNGIYLDSTWNSIDSKGFAYYLLFDYYLTKYNFIVSGGDHSNKGETFWKKNIARAEKEGYKVTVLFDGLEQEVNMDDLEQYWDRGLYYKKYRFKIYKK